MPHDPNIHEDDPPEQTIPQGPLTFLRWLYGDDAPGWLTISTFDSQPTQWFPADQLEHVAIYCQAIARRYNVYFGLGLRKEQIENGRGESDDVLAIPGFWIELDIRHPVHKKVNLPETLEQAVALVAEAIPLKPSATIDSGYGGHFHWFFRELWRFDSADDRQAAYHLLHRLQATIQAVAKLHGWEVDSTFDLARVLRVPGTYNRNVPDNPRLVTILEAHPDYRYNPSDFDAHLIEVNDPSHQETTRDTYDGELPQVDLQTLKIPAWLKYLIHVGHDPDYVASDSTRSAAEFKALQGLIEAGLDDPTIMSLMLDPRYGISEKPREKGRKWLASDLARAHAKRNGYQSTSASAPEPERSDTSSEGHHTGKMRDTPPTTLADVEQVFKTWLNTPDFGLIRVQLGAIAGNLIEGADPVWLMEIGGSGWGKTEHLQSASGLPFVHVAATLTEAALLSGTPRKDKATNAKGGLLREIGTFGVLILKDFTSILAMHRDQRAAVLAALREVYDGEWTRHVGVDGGRTLPWSGKIGVIAGVTSTIDRHHTVISTMGERFIFYRLEQPDEQQQAQQGLKNVGKEKTMRAALSAAVKALFADLVMPVRPASLSPEEELQLIAWARLSARCRSPIERDSYSREIELIPDPEAPVRLAQILLRLFSGMLAIGVPRPDAWKLIRKVSFDCMPAIRCKVLQFLLLSREPKRSTTDFATQLGYPTETARRALEDLTAHRILVRESQGKGKPDLWALSPLTLSLTNSSPEMSGAE
jgi:hypothetical protein